MQKGKGEEALSKAEEILDDSAKFMQNLEDAVDKAEYLNKKIKNEENKLKG